MRAGTPRGSQWLKSGAVQGQAEASMGEPTREGETVGVDEVRRRQVLGRPDEGSSHIPHAGEREK